MEYWAFLPQNPSIIPHRLSGMVGMGSACCHLSGPSQGSFKPGIDLALIDAHAIFHVPLPRLDRFVFKPFIGLSFFYRLSAD